MRYSSPMEPNIKVAKSAGFCFGVDRAVNLAISHSGSDPVYTLGPIIHNRHMVDYLAGIRVFSVDGIQDIPKGHTVIIRSHGVGKETYDRISEAGLRLVDATCPFVKRIHRLAEAATRENRLVVVIGDIAHPEVIGILGWCGNAVVFSSADQVSSWLSENTAALAPMTVLSQTTLGRDTWIECKDILKKECTNAVFFDTICNATDLRRQEAADIASACDCMVIVGDPMSSNSARLADICRKKCNSVYLISDAGELPPSALTGCHSAGLTAGASTPEWVIKEVLLKMTEEMNNTAAIQTEDNATEVKETVENTASASMDFGEDETFEQMLEHSFKTLNTGDKVNGIVASVTPTEVRVELGTKHAGYIPVSEVSDDPTVKLEDVFTVGQEVETYVLRVNDVEGTVMLSKRRLDSVKGWEDVEAARESGVTLEGIVTEENKGGIVVSVKGVRVFVPASQSGLPKDSSLSALVKTRVKLRITDINRVRRRVVGSIRAVQFDERREMADKVWQEIENGKKYSGVVKSLTTYGAFVDIGGVDGMVHVSELSWNRIRQPSDVISVGDKLDVYVISFDKEKRKISLGHRLTTDNPWNKFVTTHNVGDTVKVKVVKLMPFGAFAEVMPGVDGLIHISQITNRRIGKPGDVLAEGQEVDVKITEIDNEKQKISLSIRALLEGDQLSDSDIANASLPDEIVAVSGESESADTAGDTDEA